MSTSTHPPIGSSDHLVVESVLSLKNPKKTVYHYKKIWCYDKADISKLINDLQNAEWNNLIEAPNVDSATDFWNKTFLSLVNKHVPSKKLRSLKPKLPWITIREEQEIKLKHSLFRKYKNSGLQEDREAFRLQRNKVTQLLRKAERNYTITLFRSSRSTSSDTRFWSYIRSVTGKTHHRPIPNLITDAGTTLQNDMDKANAFNMFFQKQTDLQRNQPADPSNLPKNAEKFSFLCTSPSEVYDILVALPKKKAPGCDGITTDLLRLCAPGIAESLAILFNRSFSDGAFPSAWKLALVTPVFKKGNAAYPNNYRPISLLSAVGKVCEKIVHKKLYRFAAPLLSNHQSGFRKKDGSALQLTRLVQEWSEALDNSEYVGVIFFDLKKAFDKVWHTGLLIKLEAAGVTGRTLQWFRNYLSDRYQCVKVNNSISDPVLIHAGVPQGAILSPLLFILYMNDLTSVCAQDNVYGRINLFADDTSMYATHSDPRTLAVYLQDAADRLSQWFCTWSLTVNIEKTGLLILRRKGMQPISLSITLSGKTIKQVSKHKHLGLLLNSTLTWRDQVDTICSKAAQRIGLLYRLRRRLSKLALRSVYLTAVRPILEYAQLAWSGLSATDNRKLERLQRRAARLITGERLGEQSRGNIEHDLLLSRAGLSTLSSRRRVALCMLAFDLVHCRLPPHCTHFFQTWCPTKPERSNSLRPNTSNLIRLPKPNTSLIPRSPMYSAISLWNSLPNNFRTINARTTFHSALKEHFCWVYVHPLIPSHFFAVPVPCSLPNRCPCFIYIHPSIYSPPPPPPPSISFTPRHLFFISPFTLAVLLGYWARVENNNNNNNNNLRLEKSGLDSYITNSPSWSEALHFIDSAKFPFTLGLGLAFV